MHHTWGTPMHPLRTPPCQLTARSVSRVCLRGKDLCTTCDGVGKTVESALQGWPYVFDHQGEKRMVVIESQPSALIKPTLEKKNPGWVCVSIHGSTSVYLCAWAEL